MSFELYRQKVQAKVMNLDLNKDNLEFIFPGSTSFEFIDPITGWKTTVNKENADDYIKDKGISGSIDLSKSSGNSVTTDTGYTVSG